MSEKKKSVYASIADDIIIKIKGGIYPVSTLLPPERELMEVYSVQRTTVRRGLDILSTEGYIEKVAGIGSVVKSAVPVKHKASQSKAENAKASANEYAILLPESKKNSLDGMPHLVLDLLSCLGKRGAGFMSANLSDIPENACILALDTNPDVTRPVCLTLCQDDDRRSVILDNDKGAYVALTYLEELGHTKIAFIGTDKGLSFQNAAYDAFCAVNSFLDEELTALSGTDEKSGFDAFSELLRRHGRKFTAVCTVNDDVARGVIKAAKYYKMRVPEDISVLSLCSSEGKIADCIRYDTDELAKELIYSADNSHRVSTVLFGGNLVKANSCASIKPASENEKNMSDFLL